MDNPIRVFLSYSWDSEAHKQRVLALAQRLRADGVDAWLDRFTSFPEQGWPRWMQDEIERAQFVVVLATEKYAQRFAGNAPAGTGLGATWEGAIITQDLYEAGGRNQKFLPAIFAGADSAHIPKPLRPFTHFRVDTDSGCTDLYRLITGQQEILPLALGKKRELPSVPVGAQRPALPVPEIHEPITFSAVHQLPPPPPAFTGRDEHLLQLEEQLTSAQSAGATISAAHRHAGLQGTPGVGKTALALVLADRLKARYPDAQLFLNLRGADPDRRPPRPAAELMAEVIHAFHPEARLPETVDALTPIYHSVLAGAGRVLLLLDNAAGADQVRPLLPPGNCLLLVTSRAQFTLPGLAARNLDCLLHAQAEALLCRLAARFQAGSDEVKEAAQLCGGLPLALEVFAGAVNDRQLYPLPELLHRLRDRQDKLAPVDAAFQVSYELLSEELRRCWRLLAVFPASFDLRAAAAVWDGVAPASAPAGFGGVPAASSNAGPGGPAHPQAGTPALLDSAREAMQTLMRASLVEWNETNGRFRLHDLIRQFCEAKLRSGGRESAGDSAGRGAGLEAGGALPSAATEETAARLRHAAHCHDVAWEAKQLYLKGGEHVLRGLELFDRERVQLEAAFEFLAAQMARGVHAASTPDSAATLKRPEGCVPAESAALLVSLVDAVAYTGDLRFHPRQRIRWLEAQRDAARLARDRGAEGAALGNLCLAYAALGDARKAVEFYGQRLVIAREIGDRRGEGNALWNSALALDSLGDRAQAIARAEAALKILEAIEDPNAAKVRAKLEEWRSAQ
jgi:tetratricopeptide (TPR) repeat protein